MPVSKANPESGEPEEWAVGAKVARFARKRTAARVSDLIVDEDMTGSKDLLRLRLAKLAEAEREGDPLLIHEAAMELSAAAGTYAVGIQLRTPFFTAALREEMKEAKRRRRIAAEALEAAASA